jgi:hypothetical protein
MSQAPHGLHPSQRDQARGLSYKQKSNWPVPTSDSPFKADIRQFGWIVRYVPMNETARAVGAAAWGAGVPAMDGRWERFA